MKRSFDLLGLTVLCGLVFLAGCGDDPTDVDVELQVIEEVEFAPSLGIDLDEFTRKLSGMYFKDIVVGEGDPARTGDLADVSYVLWLTDGTEVETARFDMVVDAGIYLSGFEEGVRSIRPGGVRMIILPPGLAYGKEASQGIPAGSILIFEITLHGLS